MPYYFLTCYRAPGLTAVICYRKTAMMTGDSKTIVKEPQVPLRHRLVANRVVKMNKYSIDCGLQSINLAY